MRGDVLHAAVTRPNARGFLPTLGPPLAFFFCCSHVPNTQDIPADFNLTRARWRADSNGGAGRLGVGAGDSNALKRYFAGFHAAVFQSRPLLA